MKKKYISLPTLFFHFLEAQTTEDHELELLNQ